MIHSIAHSFVVSFVRSGQNQVGSLNQSVDDHIDCSFLRSFTHLCFSGSPRPSLSFSLSLPLLLSRPIPLPYPSPPSTPVSLTLPLSLSSFCLYRCCPSIISAKLRLWTFGGSRNRELSLYVRVGARRCIGLSKCGYACHL